MVGWHSASILNSFLYCSGQKFVNLINQILAAHSPDVNSYIVPVG